MVTTDLDLDCFWLSPQVTIGRIVIVYTDFGTIDRYDGLYNYSIRWVEHGG